MVPFLLPLDRFQHWKSRVKRDTDILLKGGPAAQGTRYDLFLAYGFKIEWSEFSV